MIFTAFPGVGRSPGSVKVIAAICLLADRARRKAMKNAIALLSIALATAAPGAEPRAKERFIGTWELVSFESRSASGDVTYPRGRRPAGRLTYDREGRMAVQIMQRERLKFASENSRTATAAEAESAFRGYSAYFGTYRVDEAAGYVIHKVEASLFPNWVGTDQKRFFRFEDNRLTLEADGPAGRSKLVWERVR
jgi:hypothetical protein